MNTIFKMFPYIFGTMLVAFLLTFAAGVFLGASCYFGNDPNAMACYMISDRHEFGIRNR